MILLNNDIKELESHIIRSSNTKGILEVKNIEIKKATYYLKKKYNLTNIGLDKCTEEFINYLNQLNKKNMMELLRFSKKIYIEKFGEKYGSYAFSFFAGGLMEDGERYSETINSSTMINNFLLKEFNETIHIYYKNHKYEIGKYIYIIMRNLGLEIPTFDKYDIYDYWEHYLTDE